MGEWSDLINGALGIVALLVLIYAAQGEPLS